MAFLEHPVQWDNRGWVSVVDRAGKKQRLSGEWAGLEGLAWAPSGKEVWFTGSKAGESWAIYAMTLFGRQRLIARAPNDLLLQDIGADGSALISPVLLQNATTLNAVAMDAAGNIYATGAATDPTAGGVYVVSLDGVGNLLAEMQFGGSTTVDAGYGIAVTSTGSLWIVGDTTLATLATDGTTLNGTQDGFLATVMV